MNEKTTSIKRVDLRGLMCPEPVLRTKRLLDEADTQRVEALVDSEVNVNNLERLSKSLKWHFSSAPEDQSFLVTLEKTGSAASPAQEQHSHALQVQTPKQIASNLSVGTVVVLSKDRFGEGDADFSTKLIDLFLQTMYESGQRPRAILMVNTGVRLMDPELSTLKVLNDFKDAGVEVLACGLCVEFYGLKGKIPKEQITNMFAICEYMFAADKVITP